MNRDQKYTTQAKADIYDSAIEVFNHLYKELRTLGTKKPSETLSEHKVKVVNRLLSDLAEALKDETESKYLDLLDDEVLPQYSDAIFALAQYDGALKSFYSRYRGYQPALNENTWFIK